MSALPQISEAEYEVMKIVWKYAPINTNEITEKLLATSSWSAKTIQTLIKRLVNKGVLTYEKDSRVFVYSPLVKESDYIDQKSKSFLGIFNREGVYEIEIDKTPKEKKESKIQTKDALENIMGRKSVRKYLPKPVEKEKIEVLLKAGMAAPSGKDVRPWELIVIDDREVLDSMAAVLPYAKMLKEAPMAIVVCGDTTKSSYWYLDCSAVTQNILLAAEAIGLGAVWTATYPYADRMEVVKKYTGIPEQINSLCVIPVGYPAMPHSPKDKWDASKVHMNKW